MKNIKKHLILSFICFFSFITPSQASDVTKAGASNVKPIESIDINKYLQCEKTTQDLEIQNLKKELSDKDKIISVQKKRIKTLSEANSEMQTNKYRYNVKVDRKNQENISEQYNISKKDNFEELKTSQPGNSLITNQKTTMEDLYHQLTEVLKEEIEKGYVSIKFYNGNVK